MWVKHEIPWPHNHVLSGSNKSKTLYDPLSLSQWVASFSCIIRGGNRSQCQKSHAEHMTDLMEDSHDFGWPAAKASHVAMLCRMKDGRLNGGNPHN